MGSTSVSRTAVSSRPARRAGDHAAAAAAFYFPLESSIRSHGDGGNPGFSSAAVAPPSPVRPLSVDGRKEDAALRLAPVLSRAEVLRRRLRRVRQLAGYYRRQYWGLMEAVRVRHRDYYWNFGRSPMEAEERGGSGDGEQKGGLAAAGVAPVEGSGENGNRKRDKDRCAMPGCRTKAMALTRYCHLHILADQKQMLYKACSYPIKSMHTGPIICGKPVLRAQPLSYCPTHIQKAKKNVSQALKKAGLSQNLSRSLPRIHVIIAECVRQIQAKRRADQKAALKQTVDGEEAVTQASHVR